jgi:CBS domain-containing protein
MLRIKNVLGEKGSAIFAVGPDDPVLEAIRLMAEHHVGALLVMRGSELAGIVSERDYARKVVLLGRSSAETPTWQIMSSPVVSVTPEDSVNSCLALMTERRIRHLPVVVGGEVLGVVSIGDLVKAVIDEQRLQIEDLERFIRS